MKKALHIVSIILLILLQTALPNQTFAQTTVSTADLQAAMGSWQGSLTYLDYTTNKPYTMPANIELEQIQRGKYTVKHTYPNEPQANYTDTLVLSKDGTMMGDEIVKSKNVLGNGILEIITEKAGVDGNDRKKAQFRFTYNIGNDLYAKKKEVLFEGQTNWIQRHEYRYTVRAKILTPKQMKSDLALIKSLWENVHPGLYRYNTKVEIESYFTALDKQTDAPMEQRLFFILISQLNIKLQCGHSFVSYYNNKSMLKNNLYSRVYMPVLFRVVEGKFVVTHNLTDNETLKLGDEITAINGVPTRRIIDSLLTVSKADGKNGLNKKLDNITIYPKDLNPSKYCLFDIFFPLFFKPNLNESAYKLSIKPRKGPAFSVDCLGLTKGERLEKFTKKYGSIPKNEETWFLKPIDKQTVVFRLGDFTTFNWKFDFNKYLDSVFTKLNTEGYKNLIVDIRQNEGGADEARDAVLSYLTAKPLGCVNQIRRLYRYQSIPDSLLPYLDTWDNSFKQPKPDSLFYRTPEGFVESRNPTDKCVNIESQPNHFKGKVYLITDVTNSSATFTMADVVKRNKLATIVGEKTGGTLQGINGGEILFFYLPNSGIEMDVPLIFQAPNSARPDEGVLPDFEVKTTVSDIANQRDAQLDFILKMIKK